MKHRMFIPRALEAHVPMNRANTWLWIQEPPQRWLRAGATKALTVALIVGSLVGAGCGLGGATGTKASGDQVDRKPPEEFGLTLAQLTARVEQTEQRISECMQKAGFDYVALDFATIKEAMSSDKSAPGVSSEDYVKRFGLGITTQFDKPIIVFRAGPTNNAAFETLAESDQVAYRRALWGENSDWNHVRALEEEDFSETGGCTRSAAEQTYKPNELSGTYVNPADKLLEQDPRVIAATAKWADCMRTEGFPYDNPAQVEDDLRQRLTAVAQGQDPRALAGPALIALTELQDQERATATRLVACEEEHLEPVISKVEAELYGARAS
jgi:hypothetical protein